MVIKEFSIKIIDFGMAKHVKDAYSPQSDCSSTVVGTLPYMVSKNWFYMVIVEFLNIYLILGARVDKV